MIHHCQYNSREDGEQAGITLLDVLRQPPLLTELEGSALTLCSATGEADRAAWIH